MDSNPEDIALNQTHAWYGTAIGWLNSYNSCTKKLPIISPWFCGIELISSNINILAYSVYMPTCGKDEEFCEVIQTLTCDLQTHMSDKHILLLCMDSNQSKISSHRRTFEMNKFIEMFSLTTILKNNNNPTFHHYNGSESQIDHIYYNRENVIKLNSILCKYDYSENLSSHDAILGSIRMQINEKCEENMSYVSSYTEFCPKKICWNKLNISKFQQDCALELHELCQKSDESVSFLAEEFSNILVTCAEKNNQKKKYKREV